MGNLCTGQSAVESRRKQQRAGSGSTTGFSPTEDPGHVKNGSVAPGVTSGSAMPASSRGQAPGEGAEVSAPDMEVDEYHQAHQKQSLEQDSRESSREINPRPSTGNNERGSQHEGRHRRHSSRERNAPPTAGGEATHQEATGDPRVGRNAGPGATGSADDGESGEDRSEKGDHERRHRDRSKDGEQRRARNGSHRHSHKSRPSGGSVKEGSKEGAGGQPRTRDRDRDKDGDHRGSSSRTRRGSDRGTHGEQGSSRRNDRPEGNTGESGRRRQSRGGDPAESEEARRERRERRERKRKAKEAAAAAAAATTRGRGGEGAVDEAPVGGSSRRSSASNATGDAFQGSSDGKSREKKSRRKEVAGATSETRADGDAREDAVGEGGKAPPYTEVVEGVFGAATGETGSGTAVAAVVAAPVVVAEAIVVNERKGKKGSSSFKVSLAMPCKGRFCSSDSTPMYLLRVARTLQDEFIRYSATFPRWQSRVSFKFRGVRMRSFYASLTLKKGYCSLSFPFFRLRLRSYIFWVDVRSRSCEETPCQGILAVSPANGWAWRACLGRGVT